jgi:hypothetical protein
MVTVGEPERQSHSSDCKARERLIDSTQFDDEYKMGSREVLFADETGS